MAVVASEDGDLVMQDPLSQDGVVSGAGETEVEGEGEGEEDEEDDEEHVEMKLEESTNPSRKSSRASSQSSQNDPKLRKDMETCFGFDEVKSSDRRSIEGKIFIPLLFYFRKRKRRTRMRATSIYCRQYRNKYI